MVQTNQPQGNATATTPTPNAGPSTQAQTSPVRSGSSSEINVTGMERVASVAGGALLLGKGLRKGGLFGLISLAMGGAAIYRGMTGHCEMKKRMMQKMG
ncbi:DUF2892 domain-containing protein [Pseudomonas sp. gcc21]|uniref:YgaP-like transmembrane domain n=1 Tax=Pseudomonas sp. gcc21 TaxID=2726989 RepID=UPI0014527B4A|nr:YgaP-like transmembrane domain [Pseudomonas sp. gcc21]QJD57545.1 DUF2892 domain-containing protein [Pseudomonas sp. gcc21]